MRKPNFSKLPTATLQAYADDIQSELAQREKISAKKEKVLAKVRSLAKAEGIAVEDLLDDAGSSIKRGGGAARKSSGTKVAPKYQNPKNPTQKWTGRGRKPKWVEEYLAKNNNRIEQLLIK